MMAEVYAFLASILCGIFSVSLWHATEALRETINGKGFINAILDVFWWVVITAVFCVCIWQILNLRIRAFEFIGVASGALLWNIVLGKPIRYLFRWIFGVFSKIIQFIFKILLTPWAFLYKILVVGKLGKLRKGKGK